MAARRSFAIRLAAVAAALAGLVILPVPATHAADKVVVFAAASLKNALDSINAAWRADSGKEATISYAASSGSRQADRGRRPGRRFHLRRSPVDEIPVREKPDQGGQRSEPARQPHRADGAEGFQRLETIIEPNFPLDGLWATAGWRWPT